jgi:hypothetical protein
VPARRRRRHQREDAVRHRIPGEFSAHCQTSGGATWLQIDRTKSATDHRPGVSNVGNPLWGLHVLDVNIALGNLVDLVRSEAAAFHG